jgi:transposase
MHGYWLSGAWKRPRIRHDEAWGNQVRDGGGCQTGIHSRVFARKRSSAACSVIGMCGSSRSTGAQKTACGCCGRVQTGWYDQAKRWVRDLSSAGFRIVLEFDVRRVACRSCGAVKRERLGFLADNPHFTRRFAFYVGRRCRQAVNRHGA